MIGNEDFIEGLRRAIEIIQGESYPESHGLVSVDSIVRDLEDEIDSQLEEA